ncbi:tRNA lysidine(34) synthetase TilS [Rhodococcoides corynebacterioides]|uniref:tRNA(Ile)-lysidine synthase n=1 Tax=Rhodococcoides corynebacterioides TaxID=53972 RepID=A0ABS7P359_9NOCA|nr:tRNA lysidine(34) synthetase TilS [Rhodococcus corynebacterioides]MBY6366854.1 tRNA lysidine(34) synthetase TilS [Rhodococcus corynebacterioides]MBY6409137.1 tRNA lysidine(34) synthetase TilS [Rhodococcus corynebacterioides]
MTFPETPALHRVRRAVREWRTQWPTPDGVVVGCSGGADSTALVAGCCAEGLAVRAVVVDHGLQDGSAEVAAAAAARAETLGATTTVVRVRVSGSGGLEAAARRARRTALTAAADGRPVLLGHTLDDQAETVLLGLGRGAGAGSLRAMTPWSPPWGRPLLSVRRADTVAACAELGVDPWTDPHNADPRFTRVRVRTEVLPLLEEVLQGGVAEALARTARRLREDDDALAALADELLGRARSAQALVVDALVDAPAAIRRRAVLAWLRERGADVRTDASLRAVDDLVVRWRGQGGVALARPAGPVSIEGGGRLVAIRRRGKLEVIGHPRDGHPLDH